jgi:hypothetical protein
MSPADFTAWLARMGWSDSEAARRLGCGRNSIRFWRQRGAPLYIGLACTTLALGYSAWKQPDTP